MSHISSSSSLYSRFGNRFKANPMDPPRPVPVSVSSVIFLGGAVNQFGWVFFGFGMLFVWVFGLNDLLYQTVFFSGEVLYTDGIITEAQETGTSINDNMVWEYYFKYEVDGIAYTGEGKGFDWDYERGDEVEVEFVATNPSRARVPELKTGSSGGLLFACIFPFIGLAFIFFGIRKGLKGHRLLKMGKLAVGYLDRIEETNMQVNDQMVCKYTFIFKDESEQTYKVVAKTHDESRFAGEALSDLEQENLAPEGYEKNIREPLLYDPANPGDAIMLDDLPGGPRINVTGEIEGRMGTAILFLSIPGLVLTVHFGWFLHVLELL